MINIVVSVFASTLDFIRNEGTGYAEPLYVVQIKTQCSSCRRPEITQIPLT